MWRLEIDVILPGVCRIKTIRAREETTWSRTYSCVFKLKITQSTYILFEEQSFWNSLVNTRREINFGNLCTLLAILLKMEPLDYSEHFAKLENFSALMFNGSNPFAKPEEDYYFLIVVPILFGFVTLTGVIGNSLVIYVICTKKKMRTLTNLLLLNLAFADLSFVLICPPFTAYQFAMSYWPLHGVLGDVVCKLMHYLLNVTAYVTIYTLVLIAALRYFTIVHSVATVKYRTKKVIQLLVCGIWVTMLLLNIPILSSYGVQPGYLGLPDCNIYRTQNLGKKVFGTLFIFAYLLPLVVIGLFSIGILLHINGSSSQPGNLASRSECRKRHASRLVITVVVIFALFWFPVHIHLLCAYFYKVPETYLYDTVSVLFNFLAYLNSCINPLIYDSTSKDFRMAFREAVCCKKPEPSAPSGQKIPLVSMQKQTNEINGNNRDLVAQVTEQEALNSPTTAQSVSV